MGEVPSQWFLQQNSLFLWDGGWPPSCISRFVNLTLAHLTPLASGCMGVFGIKPMWLMVKNPQRKSISVELHWFLRMFWVASYDLSRCRCCWKIPAILLHPSILWKTPFTSWFMIHELRLLVLFWYSPQNSGFRMWTWMLHLFLSNISTNLVEPKWLSKWALQSARCNRASLMHVRWNSQNNDNVKSSWVASQHLGWTWAQVGSFLMSTHSDYFMGHEILQK